MIGQQQAQSRFDQRNETVQRTPGASQSGAMQPTQQVGQSGVDKDQRDVAVVAVLGYN